MTMNAALANCKKCKKLFQKRISDLCADCIALEDEQVRNLYRILQKSGAQGGMAIEELSHETGVSVEEIEEFYHDGRLGTAAPLLKFQCISCGIMMGELQRKGRYCVNCSEKMAAQAGVAVKNTNDLARESAEAQKRQEQMALLKKSNVPDRPPSGGSSRRFGMVSRRP